MGSSEPLPQRRATEPPPVDGELTEEPGPRIPRQIPSSPEAWSTGPAGPRTPPDLVIDAIDADVVEERTIATPAVPAPGTPPPPAWPPVPAYPGSEQDADDPGAAPPVPEEFAAALDITSEMPRIRIEDEIGRQPERPHPDWNGQSGATRIVSSPTGQPPTVPAGYAPPPLVVPAPSSPPGAEPARLGASHPDETMELPIFRELESAWFRGRESAPVQASGYPEESEFGTQRQPMSPVEPVVGAPAAPVPPRASDNGNMGGSPVPAGRVPAAEQSWSSAADDGWTAASAAADPAVTALTDAGLPKRVPMAQLVPGGVDKGTTNANRRSPEQVRGLLSAYHRGVQRGRTRDGADKTPESSTAAGNSSQAGREQEA
jgi:hypothetical protein